MLPLTREATDAQRPTPAAEFRAAAQPLFAELADAIATLRSVTDKLSAVADATDARTHAEQGAPFDMGRQAAVALAMQAIAQNPFAVDRLGEPGAVRDTNTLIGQAAGSLESALRDRRPDAWRELAQLAGAVADLAALPPRGDEHHVDACRRRLELLAAHETRSAVVPAEEALDRALHAERHERAVLQSAAESAEMARARRGEVPRGKSPAWLEMIRRLPESRFGLLTLDSGPIVEYEPDLQDPGFIAARRAAA